MTSLDIVLTWVSIFISSIIAGISDMWAPLAFVVSTLVLKLVVKLDQLIHQKGL